MSAMEKRLACKRLGDGDDKRRCVRCGNEGNPGSSNASFAVDYCVHCKEITEFGYGVVPPGKPTVAGGDEEGDVAGGSRADDA